MNSFFSAGIYSLEKAAQRRSSHRMSFLNICHIHKRTNVLRTFFIQNTAGRLLRSKDWRNLEYWFFEEKLPKLDLYIDDDNFNKVNKVILHPSVILQYFIIVLFRIFFTIDKQTDILHVLTKIRNPLRNSAHPVIPNIFGHQNRKSMWRNLFFCMVNHSINLSSEIL